jgi:hypothetical protein
MWFYVAVKTTFERKRVQYTMFVLKEVYLLFYCNEFLSERSQV